MKVQEIGEYINNELQITTRKHYKIGAVIMGDFNGEFDYMNATEHVNSIFGLNSIIKYNFKNSIKESYIPFKIKSFDFNLFYNVHITKKN